MIDLANEQSIPLSRACREVIPQFTGSPISPQTGYRWSRTGILAADGSRVRLAAVKVGRQLVTTESAIERFFAELATRGQQFPTPKSETRANLRSLGLVSGDDADAS